MMANPVEKLKEIDWGFAKEETRSLTHGIHRYSSKFPPQIARHLIENLTTEGERVLDNFVGSGTTLLEANLAGRHSVGVDLNPVACEISAAKVQPIEPFVLKLEVERLIGAATRNVAHPKGQVTLTGEGRTKGELARIDQSIHRWFFDSDLKDLLAIYEAISQVDNIPVRRLATVSLSEILRRSSKAHSGYPNLMIDKKAKPKGTALKQFERQLRLNRDRVIELDAEFKPGYGPEVIRGDAKNLSFDDEEFHLVISHPPYIGAVPYAEFLRLSLSWLGFNPKEMDMQFVGGNRHGKDVVQRFLEDMQLAFAEMFRVLRPARYCCVVIGNPVVRGELVRLNRKFVDIGANVGLKYVDEIPRQRINMRKGVLKDEYVLIFQKP